MSANSNKAANTRPFLKWAGGKHRCMATIRKRLPPAHRLVEPFVGSGAVFLNTDYEAYYLADINPDLIALFRLLRSEGNRFIDECRRYFVPRNNAPGKYYALRDRFNEISHDQRTDRKVERAALFVYLNRHGYNGLCRYNLSGAFNVPFGRYTAPYFPCDEMRTFAQKARERDVLFSAQGYFDTFRRLQAGDVVYCDPPYVPLSTSSNFTGYAPGGFSFQDQINLAHIASQAEQPVVLTNHANWRLTRLYRDLGARVHQHRVRRTISCKGAKRRTAEEVIAVWPGDAVANPRRAA